MEVSLEATPTDATQVLFSFNWEFQFEGHCVHYGRKIFFFLLETFFLITRIYSGEAMWFILYLWE